MRSLAITTLAGHFDVQRRLETPRGTVEIRGALSPETLETLTLDPSLRMFRVAEQQKRALVRIAAQPLGAVVAAIWGDLVVGYATFHPPDSACRWANAGLPMLELGALEVASTWRFMRLGRNVLEVAFSADVLEDFIVFSTEYCWHWDLEATRLSVWEYRRLLYAILTNAGLIALPTDDPEVLAHPANMLTARCGSRVPPSTWDHFQRLVKGPVSETHPEGR